MTEHSDHVPGEGDEDGFDIPVLDDAPAPAVPRSPEGTTLDSVADAPPARPADGRERDWTRGDPVRDDPGTLGDEARKLWDAVREQFVDPLLRNYPEAAGHLSSAGLEFASAFRALVRGSERRWTGEAPNGSQSGSPSEPRTDAPSDWDGRIVIGEDGSETDNNTADRPTDLTED